MFGRASYVAHGHGDRKASRRDPVSAHWLRVRLRQCHVASIEARLGYFFTGIGAAIASGTGAGTHVMTLPRTTMRVRCVTVTLELRAWRRQRASAGSTARAMVQAARSRAAANLRMSVDLRVKTRIVTVV